MKAISLPLVGIFVCLSNCNTCTSFTNPLTVTFTRHLPIALPAAASHTQSPSLLRYKSDGSNGDDSEDVDSSSDEDPAKTPNLHPHNKKVSPPPPPPPPPLPCLRQLLTQRSVQSFLFLLGQCRDLPTVGWIEDCIGTNDETGSSVSVLRYHGLGALNWTRFDTWDSPLVELMERPEESVVVTVKERPRKTKNPYLQNREISITIDINPLSLSTRILSVREQLAKEWQNDLDIVVKTGDVILSSYIDNVIKERDDEVCSDDCGPQKTDDGEPGESATTSTNTTEATVVKMSSFDRDLLNTMVENNVQTFDDVAKASSPLRRSNLDLIFLLATHESVRRVLCRLKDESSSDSDGAQYEWLEEFYATRGHYFTGHEERYYRADDFLEEMLTTSPSVVKKRDAESGEDVCGIIDPFGLVERILRVRGEVAVEWKDLVGDAPSDHVGLRKMVLGLQMRGVVDEEEEVVEVKEGGWGEFE